MKSKKLFYGLNIFFKILAVGLGLFVVVMVLWKLLGNSPTTEDILMVYLAFITSIIVSVIFMLVNIKGDMGEIKASLKYSNKKFEALANDFKKYVLKNN
tara:strand:- start:2824 stop:3120 length:297 start_codon:yes stop_codon:yes gene_type:complete